MIDFAYPWVLFGGVPVALLGIYFIRWRREPSVVVATAAPFRAARRRRLGWPDWLYLLGALLLVIALARPRYGDEKVVVRAQGIDIIIALDMSGSMQAVDLPRRIATREQLKNAYREIKEVNGIVRARRLAPFVLDGSGSPLETTMCLLEFLPAYRGGEQWEIPHLNRTVLLNENVRNIQDGDHLVADQEWHSRLAILEVNGMGHHADPTGFARTSRRRVSLEAMGYVVREINYEQIEDLDKLNIILESYAEPLGLKHRPRTASFLDARERLHGDLFSIPGIHGKALIDNPGW